MEPLRTPSPTDDVATLSPNAPADNDQRGAVAGYAIESVVGRGGMGVVYKARQTALQRTVALKMILAGGHASEAELQRFRTEGEAIAQLQHPNIVQIYEVGEQGGLPYFSLEFCPGGSLQGRLNGTPLVPMEAARLVGVLAAAMQMAHNKGIVHRDLSPGNVLFDAEGTPKISDFGLAKKLDEASKTATGAVVGTPSYMPPEQASGRTKEVGPTSDVYALGAILYECLTGRPPFKAATAMDTLFQVIADEPVPPRTLNAQVPRDLETICVKCLQKEPNRRFATAQELSDDLNRYRNGEPIRARPVGLVERAVKWVRRNPVVSGLVATVLLASTSGAIVSGYFANAARLEATAARNAETEAAERAGTEAVAKTLAQQETKRAEAEAKRAEEQLQRAEWLVYAGKLSLAQSAFAEGNGAVAMQHLEECQWNLRGWEHHHLWTLYNSNQRTLRGHTGRVSSVALSPDGTRILTGSWDYTAKVWDAEKGQEILSLKGHTGSVENVAWSPDGKRILTRSGGTAKVWDADKGTELLSFTGHTGGVMSVAWSPDGKRILSGSGGSTVQVWGVEKGQEALSFKTRSVSSVAFSPDGKRILTGSYDNTAKVWDAYKGTDLMTLKGHIHSVTSVAWSPDGRRILTGSVDNTAKVWDAEKGQDVLSLKGHTDRVESVAWSPDGKRILTRNGVKATVWDAAKGQELLSLKGHTAPVTSLAWSPDGKRILMGSLDRTAKVWDADKGQELLSLKGHTGPVTSLAWSPDSKRILTGSWDKTAKVWDADKGTEVLTLKGHTGTVTSVAWSLDGKRILTGGGEYSKLGEVKVWNADKGQEVLSLKGHTQTVVSVAWSPDGTRILTGSYDQSARVWDVGKGTELLTLKGHTGPVNSVGWSPDGKRILTGGDKTAKLWDADRDTEALTLHGHTSAVISVAWSPDGKHILTGSHDQTAKVWDADKKQELRILKGHTNTVRSVAFSLDGQTVFAWDAQNKVLAWSVADGKPVNPTNAPAQTPKARLLPPMASCVPRPKASSLR